MVYNTRRLAKDRAREPRAHVSLLTNMVPPYRETLFAAIAASRSVEKLRILICTEREVDRQWAVPAPTAYIQKRLAGFTLNLRRGSDGRRIMHFRFGILWELVRHRPDILIIGDASWTSYLGAAACRIYGIPYIVWNEITTSSRVSRGLPSALRGLMYRRASGFVASGRAAREHLVSKSVDPASIVTAHNTVDNAYFEAKRVQYEPCRGRLRAELGIRDDAFCFIFVGQLVTRKRVVETLSLIGQAARLHPMHLLVVGSGELEDAMRMQAQAIGFGEVTFCGFAGSERLCELYVAADALVLLSSDEPWGMVVNEIMLFGKGYLATPEVGAALEMADGIARRCIPFSEFGVEEIIDYVETCRRATCATEVQPTCPEHAAELFATEISRITDTLA